MSGELRLLFVRHGQSTWNAEGRWQGRADPPLSELGLWQAREAAGVLGGFDAIVASPLVRAAHTAAVIAEEIGIGPLLLDPDLVERDAGEWSGLTRAQIEQRWPGHLADGRRPPGYEDDDSVLTRALRAIDRIVSHVGAGEVLVVTHGGVVYSLERHAGARFERMGNLGGRWFHRDRDGRLHLGERVTLVDPTHTTVPDVL